MKKHSRLYMKLYRLSLLTPENTYVALICQIRQEYTIPVMILGLHPANERRRYKVTPSLIGWVQT